LDGRHVGAYLVHPNGRTEAGKPSLREASVWSILNITRGGSNDRDANAVNLRAPALSVSF